MSSSSCDDVTIFPLSVDFGDLTLQSSVSSSPRPLEEVFEGELGLVEFDIEVAPMEEASSALLCLLGLGRSVLKKFWRGRKGRVDEVAITPKGDDFFWLRLLVEFFDEESISVLCRENCLKEI